MAGGSTNEVVQAIKCWKERKETIGPKCPPAALPHTSAGSSSVPLCLPGISLALNLPVCPLPPDSPIRTSGQTTEQRHRLNDHTPHIPISTRSLLESHLPTRNPATTNLFSVSRISSQACYINVIVQRGPSGIGDFHAAYFSADSPQLLGPRSFILLTAECFDPEWA